MDPCMLRCQADRHGLCLAAWIFSDFDYLWTVWGTIYVTEIAKTEKKKVTVPSALTIALGKVYFLGTLVPLFAE